jgi:hypothetical protein
MPIRIFPIVALRQQRKRPPDNYNVSAVAMALNSEKISGRFAFMYEAILEFPKSFLIYVRATVRLNKLSP